jgi:hypothetical protein
MRIGLMIVAMLALAACGQQPTYTYVPPPLTPEHRELNKAAMAGMYFPVPDRRPMPMTTDCIPLGDGMLSCTTF